MKTFFPGLMVFFAPVVLLLCCGEIAPSKYALELPKPPDAWLSLLGEPHRRVEWLSPDGVKQIADIPPGKGLSVEIPVTWANPVTAWPYWPEHNLLPGSFKPAGALFPFDAEGSVLRLSWEAGHDTIFYWEMALANEGNMSRAPANFNWPRFRELFAQETINKEVCEDPWLVDWRSAAERTISSGFRSNSLQPEKSVSLDIDISEGTWYGASPFAGSLSLDEGKETIAFPVRSGGVNVWVSCMGILRCSEKAWVLKKWE